jgi:hypothetical protein
LVLTPRTCARRYGHCETYRRNSRTLCQITAQFMQALSAAIDVENKVEMATTRRRRLCRDPRGC